jgi:maltose O-acetyltransferase
MNPGIRIGRNSIVGANAVITSDIQPDSIYGGIPAKLIRKKKYPDA